MTTTTPAPRVPVQYGLATVSDHLSAVFARPLAVPRRLDVQWISIQPTNPSSATAGQNDDWDPTLLDTIATNAIANGIRHLLLTLTYCSQAWAGGSGDGHLVPRDAANGCRDYANIHRLAAKYMHDTYPGLTVYWGLWNEPQNGFMGPVTLALRATYIKMLQARADAARNGNIVGRGGTLDHYSSGGDLWTGGTGAGPSVGSPFRHLNWLQAIVDADADCFDHVDMHLYSGACPLGTSNGYDPWANDVLPGRAYLDSHGRPDAQINSGEGGWFWRPDGTATNTSDAPNCNAYGVATGGNKNLSIEVDVTTQASRITARRAFIKANAGVAGFGLDFLYQQDTTAPNNTDLDGSGNASAAFNHAGLYQYAPGRNGTPVLDGSSVAAPLNAFVAAAALDTSPPTVIIRSPASGSVVTGDFTITAGVIDDVSPDSAITVTLINDDTSAVIAPMVYTPAGVPFGFNRQFDGHSTDGSWPDAIYHLRVHAVDEAGNASDDTITLHVENDTPPLPSVTALSAHSGSAAGGDSIIIDGALLSTVTAVRFGSTAAASFALDTPTVGRITAVTPAHTPKTVPVRVTTANGDSPKNPADRFTFTGGGGGAGSPTVTGVSPAVGPLAGGNVVVVTGTDFE